LACSCSLSVDGIANRGFGQIATASFEHGFSFNIQFMVLGLLGVVVVRALDL